MTELSDIELEAFNNAMKEVKDTYGALNQGMLAFKKSIFDGNTTLKGQADLYKARKRVDQGLNDEIRMLTESYKRGEQTYDTAMAAFEEMRKKVLLSAAGNTELQKSIEVELNVKQKALQLELRYQASLGKLVNFVGQTGKSLLDSAQSGGSSLEIGLSNAAVGATILNSAFQTATKAGMSLGQALMTIPNGAAQLVGALTYAASYIFNYAETKAKDLFDAAKPFMDKEVKILDEAFRGAAKAGALFADGASGMSRAAADSGLRLEAFSKSVSENSADIGLLGGNIARGIQQIARVNKAILDGDIGKNLLNLGFNLEEIPGLIAQVGGRMKRAGMAVDDVTLQKATADYAKNLRIIADITGKDAKTALDQADQRMNDLAFQQELASRGGDISFAMQQSLAAVPESVQDMVKEMVVSGGNLTSDITNLTAQQAPALKAVADQIYAQFNANALTAQTGRDALAANASEALKEINNMKDFARAASITGGDLKTATEQIMGGYNSILKLADPETYKKMIENSTKAADTQDDATKSLRQIKIDGNEAARAMQDLTNKALVPYMLAIRKLNDLTVDAIRAFSNLTGGRTGGNGQASTGQMRDITEAARAGTSLGSQGSTMAQIIRSFTEEGLQDFAKQQNITPDQIAKTIGYSSYAALKQDREYRQQQELATEFAGAGMATGGIANGPTSGFPATLHGREAVIPLPDELTNGDFAKAMQALATGSTDNLFAQDAIKEMQRPQLVQASLNNELLSTLISKIDDLIFTTREVAGHTERTAIGVA